MDRRVSMKSALAERERDNSERRFHITPPHIDPIWPGMRQRRAAKKTKTLGMLIRRSMFMFKFLHSLSPSKTLALRPFIPEEPDKAEDVWLLCENVLTLREKISGENQRKLQRLREIQSEAYTSGSENRHLTEKRTDFHFPLNAQSYRTAAVDTSYQELALSRRKHCREATFCTIPRLSVNEEKPNTRLHGRSADGFERGDRNCSRFPAVVRAISEHCPLTSSARGFLENPSEDPRFQGLFSILVPPR